MNRSTICIFLILTICLLSCKSKKTVDLKVIIGGMSKVEVRKLVGEPDSTSTDNNEWYYNKTTNAVIFKDEVVLLVSHDYQKDGTYQEYQKSFSKKHAYEIQPDLIAAETNLNIKFDGTEADVVKVTSATLENGVVTISARSEKKGCEFLIVLNKDGSYSGEMSISPRKFTGKDAPFSFGALKKVEKIILNTSNFEKGTKLVIQFIYRTEVSLEMASSDKHPVVLEGVIVNQL